MDSGHPGSSSAHAVIRVVLGRLPAPALVGRARATVAWACRFGAPYAGSFPYCVRMVGDHSVVGDDPVTNGMALSIRLRRDFTVTDADRLLLAARRIYRELHPDVSAAEAAGTVTSAADALFVILEHAGLLGDATDRRLADHADDGLTLGGYCAQIVINDPAPLSSEPRSDCLRGDVFALPASDNEG
jgi:hypothetical protein